MLKYYLTFVLGLVTLLCQAQSKPNYILIGYEGVLKTYNNAYAVTNTNNLPANLKSLNFQSDRMVYSNWNLIMGTQDENFIMEADFSGLMYIIGAAFNESGGDTLENPGNMIGIGKLQNVDKQVRSGAKGYGYSLDILSFEMGIGKNQFYGGYYFGWSTFGLGSFENINPDNKPDEELFLGMRPITVSRAGLGIHYAMEDHGRIGLRYGGMWAGKNADEDYYDANKKRRGMEIHASARYFFKEQQRFGLYLEAFYRFQRWKDYEVPAKWIKDFKNEVGVIPGMVNHTAGLKLGFTIPFKRSGGRVNKNWIPNLRGQKT